MVFFPDVGKVNIPQAVVLIEGDQKSFISYRDISRHKIVSPFNLFGFSFSPHCMSGKSSLKKSGKRGDPLYFEYLYSPVI
jgi:hypothetical protein